MDGLRHAVHSLYKATAERVLPPLAKSQFEDKRVITPEEFVIAGDYLVRACPTWSWEGGDAKKRKPYLPADKQFLITRSVPCVSRASDMERYDPNSEFALEGEEDGWTATHDDPAIRSTAAPEEIPNIDDEGSPAGAVDDGDDDDVPDIGALELAEEDDEAAIASTGLAGGSTAANGLDSGKRRGYLKVEEPSDTIMRTRTYDLYITYDQYYQVPRFWLVGFDESRHPLLPAQVMEDVSEEHARKTITVDPHPHLSISAASIHPCRHAEVMKKLVDNLLEAGKTFSIEHYLVLFLKFIASVVPTIQYDYTMSVGGD